MITFDAEHARRKLAEAIDGDTDRVAFWVWYGTRKQCVCVWLTPEQARELLSIKPRAMRELSV